MKGRGGHNTTLQQRRILPYSNDPCRVVIVSTGRKVLTVTLRKIVLGSLALLAMTAPALARPSFVYCAADTITVRDHSPDWMRRNFAQPCQLSGPMDEGSANQRAQRFGGEGASCTCR